jgi:hypothetical protein
MKKLKNAKIAAKKRHKLRLVLYANSEIKYMIDLRGYQMYKIV